MCGRYYVDDDTAAEIEKIIRDVESGLKVTPGPRDIFPSQKTAVLHAKSGGLTVSEMKWGFPRPGAKGLLINARTETLLERPAFRESALNRRCIIPARGFYEWNAKKEKSAFTRRESPVLYMAGIFNAFKDELRFTIITTGANASVAPVHSRMPLVLEKDELESWVFDSQATSFILNKTPPLLRELSEYKQLNLFDTQKDN